MFLYDVDVEVTNTVRVPVGAETEEEARAKVQGFIDSKPMSLESLNRHGTLIVKDFGNKRITAIRKGQEITDI